MYKEVVIRFPSSHGVTTAPEQRSNAFKLFDTGKISQ